MKTDIIVQRAEEVVNKLRLLCREEVLKQDEDAMGEYSENEIRKYIFDIAEDDHQRNYLFVDKVLKQIDLMLL